MLDDMEQLLASTEGAQDLEPRSCAPAVVDGRLLFGDGELRKLEVCTPR